MVRGPSWWHAGLAGGGFDRVIGDHIGMLATVMNSLAMQDRLSRLGIDARTLSAFRIDQVCEYYSRNEAVRHLEAGRVVILSAGTNTYDPSNLKEFYHYGSNPNVMTSLEFERILSASGPTMGHLVRPSDEKEPKKIAWLQCVGSRDMNKCDNPYCSSVCCLAAASSLAPGIG